MNVCRKCVKPVKPLRTIVPVCKSYTWGSIAQKPRPLVLEVKHYGKMYVFIRCIKRVLISGI